MVLFPLFLFHEMIDQGLILSSQCVWEYVVCSVQWSSLSARCCFFKCENCNHRAHFSMIDWLRTGIWRVLLKFKRSIFCSWILDSSMSCPCGSAFSSFSWYCSCHFLVFQGTPWLNDGWMLWSQFVAMELLFSLVIFYLFPIRQLGVWKIEPLKPFVSTTTLFLRNFLLTLDSASIFRYNATTTLPNVSGLQI